MKSFSTAFGLIALVAILGAGCSTIAIPSAQRYFIRIQGEPNEIQANSVRIQGDWIVVEKDTPKETQFFRRNAVISIRAFQPQ